MAFKVYITLFHCCKTGRHWNALKIEYQNSKHQKTHVLYIIMTTDYWLLNYYCYCQLLGVYITQLLLICITFRLSINLSYLFNTDGLSTLKHLPRYQETPGIDLHHTNHHRIGLGHDLRWWPGWMWNLKGFGLPSQGKVEYQLGDMIWRW